MAYPKNPHCLICDRDATETGWIATVKSARSGTIVICNDCTHHLNALMKSRKEEVRQAVTT